MVEYVSVNVLFKTKVLKLSIEPNLTVAQMLRHIRKRYEVSTFEALEIRIDGKHISPEQTIFQIALNQKAFRIECVTRKYISCC